MKHRPARRFRELLASPGIIRSLGAHDVLTALIVQESGFETVFIGGFGTSASLLGLPDLDFLGASQMADAVRRMAARVSIPVIADGDTGHGDLHNVRHTVEMFEAAGAAGILIEDQVFPKRCGHFEEKRVIPVSDMVLKIRTAVRSRSDPDFVIIARTDARQVNGLDDSIDRVVRCCEAGADIAFIEAPQNRAELEEIPKRVPLPAVRQHALGWRHTHPVDGGTRTARLQGRRVPGRVSDGHRPGGPRDVPGTLERRSSGQPCPGPAQLPGNSRISSGSRSIWLHNENCNRAST